jgi:hypothetical protein
MDKSVRGVVLQNIDLDRHVSAALGALTERVG